MFNDRKKIMTMLAIIFSIVFVIASILLIIGTRITIFDLAGIRLATLFISFAAFCTTSMFSYLIYNHNNIVKKSNDDANQRAELFREFQFSSNNYSIVDFVDHMTLFKESKRYVNRFICNDSLAYHMVDQDISSQKVCSNYKDYTYITARFPYKVVEGKMVSSILFRKIIFEREDKEYEFFSPYEEGSSSFLLYNEKDKHNEAIINLIVRKDSDFYLFGAVNNFTKIKISLSLISLLGVEVKGTIELYFTNPEKKELDGTNIFKINSSNFIIDQSPRIKGF